MGSFISPGISHRPTRIGGPEHAARLASAALLPRGASCARRKRTEEWVGCA